MTSVLLSGKERNGLKEQLVESIWIYCMELTLIRDCIMQGYNTAICQMKQWSRHDSK